MDSGITFLAQNACIKVGGFRCLKTDKLNIQVYH